MFTKQKTTNNINNNWETTNKRKRVNILEIHKVLVVLVVVVDEEKEEGESIVSSPDCLYFYVGSDSGHFLHRLLTKHCECL